MKFLTSDRDDMIEKLSNATNVHPDEAERRVDAMIDKGWLIEHDGTLEVSISIFKAWIPWKK